MPACRSRLAPRTRVAAAAGLLAGLVVLVAAGGALAGAQVLWPPSGAQTGPQPTVTVLLDNVTADQSRLFLDAKAVDSHAQVLQLGVGGKDVPPWTVVRRPETLLTFTPSQPLGSGPHGISVLATLADGSSLNASSVFTVACQAVPAVEPLTPAPGGYARDLFPPVHAEVTGAGVAPSGVALSYDGQAYRLGSGDFAAGNLSLSTLYLPLGDHVLAVSATDAAGCTGGAVWAFTTDTAIQDPPQFGEPSPAAGAAVGVLRPIITIPYSDAVSGIDPSSLQFSLDGTRVAAQAGPDQASYTPAADLTAGSHLVVVRISDKAGNALTHAWSFFETSGAAPAAALPQKVPLPAALALAAPCLAALALRRRR